MSVLYSTHTLNRVVDTLRPVPQFLLQKFFPNAQTSDDDKIYFDKKEGSRRISPFVSPLMQGKVIEDEGYETKSFSPAYIKDKRVFNAEKPFTRRAGEPIGGSMSPMARQNANIAECLQDQINMRDRRMEVMASEVVRTGKLTISGEGYGTQVLDFQRKAEHTVTLSGGTAWGSAGVDPIKDIETWCRMVHRNEGAKPRQVIMDPDAWELFLAGLRIVDRNLMELFDLRRANTAANISTVQDGSDGPEYMGTDGKREYWVYSETYDDPDTGDSVEIMPSKTVILGGASIDGVRHYGAIRDERAGFQARESFVKSWVVEDPSVRYMLMQSAPILVPYRPDASLCATVG